MIALVAAVFVASVLGSLHCAGMCGAFLAFAVGGDAAGARRLSLQAAYHGGRLITYTLLGAAAGAAGALLDLTSTLAGLQPIAAGLAGGVMILFGVTMLVRHLGGRMSRIHPPRWLALLVQQGHRIAFTLPPTPRALSIGLLTTLLPCGWLYAFAVTAAGTGGPATGALVMSVFWLGTLPMLVSLGVGLQGVLGTLGRRLPVATCLLLIVVGLLTLSGRLGLDPSSVAQAMTASNDTPAASAPSSAQPLPCCIHR